MSEDLPPTSALRAFACVARRLSFKEAARDLNLSPSAVSRQIQGLEEHLGIALFHRSGAGVELTDAGRRYRADVDRILGELRAAQEALGPRAKGPLRVSALESFSAKWLVPRLAEFEAAHPRVRLEIEATLRYADFDRDPVDVALRFGAGPWEGLHSEPLCDLVYFPVCAPALLEGPDALRAPGDLARHTLIHVSQVPEVWPAWLRAAGVPDLRPRRDVVYDHVGIALSAAAAGQGVAIAAPILIEAELAEGRLRRPFDLALPSETTYHLVCREEGLADPRITAFRDWLVESLA